MSDTKIVNGAEFFRDDEIGGVQCARCGSSVEYIEDRSLDRTGFTGYACLSSREWCDAHPMPGRDGQRGAPAS